jgi:hypothetical protein
MQPQADHAEEVLDMVLPAGHQPAKVMEPSEKSLDSPTSAVPAKRATILRRCSPLSTMRCDHFDAITLGQISIQAVTVICFVANESCWEAVEEAVPEDAFDKPAFVKIPKPCLVKEVSGKCNKSQLYDLDGPDAQTTSSTSIRTRVPAAVRRTYHLTSKGSRTVLDAWLYWRMCRLGSSTTSSS